MHRPRTLPDARHEAAHAVVGVYLGLRLYRVQLLADDPEWLGVALFHLPPSKRLQAGVMYAAGAAGDAIHGIGARAREAQQWRSDFDAIACLRFTPQERRILIDTATGYLRGPCGRAWRAVTDELLVRDLHGEEIRSLVLHGDRDALEA